MAEGQKTTEDRAERRVIDASKTARLAAGWMNAGWSRRVDGGGFGSGDQVEVNVELGTAAKFGDRVTVRLLMDAGQVGRLAKTCGADQDIIAAWLDENDKTTRAKSDADAEVRELRKRVARLERRVAKAKDALEQEDA